MAIKKSRTTLAAAAAATALSGAAAEAGDLRTQAAEVLVEGLDVVETVTNASENAGRRLGAGRFERKIAPVATQVEAAYTRYHEQRVDYIYEQNELARADARAEAEARAAAGVEEVATTQSSVTAPTGANLAGTLGRMAWNTSPVADVLSGDVDRGTLQSLAGIGLRAAGKSTMPLMIVGELADGANGYQQGRAQAHERYISGVQQLVAEGAPGFGRTTGFVTEITAEGAVVHQFELAGDLRSNNGGKYRQKQRRANYPHAQNYKPLGHSYTCVLRQRL